MPTAVCEICGIRTRRVNNTKRLFMAQFPLDEERCKQWVKVTGKEDLAYVPIEKLHQLKNICKNHFRPKDFKKKKTRLKKNAIPCLGLTAKPLSDEILSEFPLHVVKDDIKDRDICSTPHSSNDFYTPIAKEHNYCKVNRTNPSAQILETEMVNIKKKRYFLPGSDKTPSQETSNTVAGSDNTSPQKTVELQSKPLTIPHITSNACSFITTPQKTIESHRKVTEIRLIPSTTSTVTYDSALLDTLDVLNEPPTSLLKTSTDCVPDKNIYSWQKPVGDDLDIIALDEEIVDLDSGAEDTMYHDNFEDIKLEEPVKNEETNMAVHDDYICNECSGAISGFRYVCVQCPDYDLCAECEGRGVHASHYVLRVPGLRPHAEIERILECLRQKLILDRNNLSTQKDSATDDFLLNSIKSEPEDCKEEPHLLDQKEPIVESTKETNNTDTDIFNTEYLEDSDEFWLLEDALNLEASETAEILFTPTKYVVEEKPPKKPKYRSRYAKRLPVQYVPKKNKAVLEPGYTRLDAEELFVLKPVVNKYGKRPLPEVVTTETNLRDVRIPLKRLTTEEMQPLETR